MNNQQFDDSFAERGRSVVETRCYLKAESASGLGRDSGSDQAGARFLLFGYLIDAA